MLIHNNIIRFVVEHVTLFVENVCVSVEGWHGPMVR